MATLLLTAVGTAVGGPIGGALGAAIGQHVDQNILFKPHGREGPRLQELAVQTSSYGSPIPRMFGRMRVAGTVIWATDLKEARESEGGGKGRPSQAVYSYSVSFAVALSSRHIQDIGRIWADGKIFRGAAGDFKSATGFRFYPGHENQLVDSLIASAELDGGTPAYRGLAVAVFEDMDLTDFGNRIPSLTFELIADDGMVGLGTIIADISAGHIATESNELLLGYAAAGPDRSDSLSELDTHFALSFSSDGEKMNAKPRQVAPHAPVTMLGDRAIARHNQSVLERPERNMVPETKVPRQVSLRYYEPERDYQAGLQNVFRPGTSRKIIHREFPAAMAAAQAKNQAQSALWILYDERISARLSVMQSATPLKPGSLIQWGDEPVVWMVRHWEMNRGRIDIMLTKAGTYLADAGQPTDMGRPTTGLDALAGQTRLILVDLPFALDAPMQASDHSRLYAAAAGETGWRQAQLFLIHPDGAGAVPLGPTAAPATIGTVVAPLGPSASHIIDQKNSFQVQLHNSDMHLESADYQQILAGYNLAAIGREIIQYSTVQPLGDNRYIISGLFRGLGGTEQEIDRHADDENFVVLRPNDLAEISANRYTPFQPVTIAALGRGDERPVDQMVSAPGRALQPLSPVHPHFVFQPDGDLSLHWTRRSRAGFIWPDHIEIALAEETEKYRLDIENSIAVETDSPEFLLGADVIQTQRESGTTELVVAIRQIGQHGISGPLRLRIPL
ncbi:MAG: phage tail protein [Parasphingorhabdus sp.]|uniref:GTA baseplate fiber-binding domain-containing protein n=1 Tax=Parasphingorhabdus sp. TaxID=2709688 RepID=UPI003299631C